MSNLRKNFLISLASSNVTMAINFMASLFIARLLSPAEIGVFSVAYVFAGLLRTIREMGLHAYIVQEKELTSDRFRTAFGISLVISIVTGLIVAGLAEVVGVFYKEPGITTVLYVIALGFLIVPFGATTMAMLRRDMRFKDIAIIDTFSALMQSGSAVLLAWLGFGFMSLAWSSLVGILASVLAVILFRPSFLPWLPSLKEWRRVLNFSGYLSGSSLVSYINSSASDLILGRLMNMESVALFNRASGLAGLWAPFILRSIYAVGLPHFAQLNREGQSLKPAFIQGSVLLVMITTPLFTLLALAAEPLIYVLFGPQWERSANVLQIICVGSLLGSLEILTRPVLTAMGHVQEQLKLDILVLVIKILAVVSSVPYGLEAVAMAYVLVGLISVFLRMRLINDFLNIGFFDLSPIFRQIIFSGACSFVGPIIALLTIPSHNSLIDLIVLVVLSVSGWLLGVLMTDNPFKREVVFVFKRAVVFARNKWRL